MPLPNDEKLIALSEEILKQFEAMFGPHPGFRPGHAKGIFIDGGRLHRLCGSVADAGATCCAGFDSSDGEVFGSTGVPLIPDNDPNADPRGMAIRFNLAEHVHTDIVAHSVNGFRRLRGRSFWSFCGAWRRAIQRRYRRLWGVIPRRWHLCRRLHRFQRALRRRSTLGLLR
jgi:Catalase.